MKSSSEISQSDWLADYPPPRSLPLDQEALRVYEFAYAIGLKTERPDNPPISFTTVVAALFGGGDATRLWFSDQSRTNGPKEEAVYSEKGISKEAVRGLSWSPGKPDPVQLSADKHLLTISARAVLQNAEAWAHRVGGSDIGVRHLVASYVLNPPANHRRQLESWGFQEARWRSSFFEWVARHYTAEQWTDASQRQAPVRNIAAFEQQNIKGDSLAFPGDEGTMLVLAAAAALHARRNDSWLRLQTVFFALVETVRKQEEVQAEIKPIWDAVQAVDARYSESFDKFFPAALAESAATPFSGLDISPRVLNALETARGLAAATRRETDGEFRVGALHLAGALISRRVDGDEGLATLGLDPKALRLALIEHAHQRAESGEIWREALGEEESRQVGRPVDLNSDEPEAVVRLDEAWTNDPLGIRRDVESFAALLASKNLEPPLSIGLFGPWGSGKTTFLKRLRRTVGQRADDAKNAVNMRQQTPFVSNVVHIEFNAWHFAEDALVSSLVDSIFCALSSHIKDDQQIAGKNWSDQRRAVLESTKRKVEAAKAVESSARAAVSQAETELVTQQAKASATTLDLQNVVRHVWSVTREELKSAKEVRGSGVLEAVGETIKSTDELHHRLNAVRARPARLLADLGWGGSLLFAALILVVPPLAAWGVGTLLATGQAGQVLSSMGAILSVIGVWVRAATQAVARVDQAVTKVAADYDLQIALAPGVAAAKEALDAARAGVGTAAASLQEAQKELARAKAEAASAELPAQMLQLVTSRLDDMSYGRELTTLSLARADLEALSMILRDQQQEQAPGTTPLRAVDRVILYIDDLDRCKPEDVVRVLQLVHMLLAFELFVVVVAVDARWVEEALKQSYPWLSAGDEGDEAAVGEGPPPPVRRSRVTPQDYLEKIFQISFWLEPMNAARAASYLASLINSPVRESGPVTGTGQDRPANTAALPSPADGKIEIAGIELDYMRALAAFVGPSPRRVKRLVNAYRLIKARMSDAQLSTFLRDRAADDGSPRSGPYQIVIGLLVIGTGAPSSAPLILGALAEWDPGEQFDAVISEFRERNSPDWTMAAQVIETLMRTQKASDVAELRGWARKVGRFLLSSPAPDVRLAGSSSPPM